jgi:hypothetical protein
MLIKSRKGISACHQPAGPDRLELVVLPLLLGEALPLSPQGASTVPLTPLRADRTFPDGSAELVCTPA